MKRMLFDWEQREYDSHIQRLNKERLQKEFLIRSIHRIAIQINNKDPFTASLLLDTIDDCIHQIGAEP